MVEPAAGATRTTFAFLIDAYHEEEVRGERRVVLRLDPRLAPYEVAVLPLSRKPELTAEAEKLSDLLRPKFMVEYDDTQSIGRRYRRQDEIGTPLCVTFDFDSLDDRAVTVRDRDTMEQVRVSIDRLSEHLETCWLDSKWTADGRRRGGHHQSHAGRKDPPYPLPVLRRICLSTEY